MNLFDLFAKITLDDSDYSRGVDKAKKSNSELKSDVMKLANVYKSQGMDMSDAMKKAYAEIDKSQYETASNSKKYSDDFGDNWEVAGDRIGSFASKLKSGLANAGKWAAAGIGAASTAITALGKIAIDYNSQIESYESNFAVMLGDMDKAKSKVAELADMGAKTPVELGDLANATQTLLAFNVSADDSTGVLQKLGDISLGNVQKLESLTRAYGKMNSSQKVTLEDINMMIDAGYNPLLNIQEATGESMEQLYERISKGKVSFTEIEEAIEAATTEGGKYYEGMKLAAQTTQGLISTLKDNAQALVAKVFTPVTEGLTKQMLPAAIDAVQKLSDAYEERGVEGMIDAAGEIVGTAVGELAKNAPQLITSGVQLIESLAQGIEDNEGTITEGAAQTFFAFANGVVKLIPTLLGVAVGLVSGFGRYIIENPDEVIRAGGELLANIALGVAEALPELVITALGVVVSLGSYLVENAGEILSDAAVIGKQVLNGIWNGVVNGWSNLTAKVRAKLKNFINSLSNFSVVGGEVVYTGGGVNGSHAGGLSYVPFDGYIAELHKGERVLTATEAKNYGGAKTTISKIDININGADYGSVRELAQAVAEEIEFIAERKNDGL